MTTKNNISLCQVTVIRPRGRFRFSDLREALESIRPWVGFCEAERIFEETLFL